MTRVRLVCRRDGSIRSCVAKGHSGYGSAGSDIVCAAVTVLLRTTAQVLVEWYGVSVVVDFSTRGSFSFCVADDVGEDSGRLIYAADFLRSGLCSLAKEYPSCVLVQEQIKD